MPLCQRAYYSCRPAPSFWRKASKSGLAPARPSLTTSDTSSHVSVGEDVFELNLSGTVSGGVQDRIVRRILSQLGVHIVLVEAKNAQDNGHVACHA
jgi:hypothetical protein